MPDGLRVVGVTDLMHSLIVESEKLPQGGEVRVIAGTLSLDGKVTDVPVVTLPVGLRVAVTVGGVFAGAAATTTVPVISLWAKQ